MPVCTYLSDYEVEKFNDSLQDKEIKELIESANKIDPGWVVEEISVFTKRWFRKPTEHKLYILYYHIHSTEYQIINFAGGSSSIYTTVEKHHVINFLNGYLGGFQHAREYLRKHTNPK